MSRENIPGRYAMQWIVDDALAVAPHGAIWVEVGVALGKGISYMARKLIDAKRDDVRLFAVDPWAGYAQNGEQQAMAAAAGGDFELFLAMMREHAPEELARIEIVRQPSAWGALGFADASVDLCIIDADHSYDAVREDLAAWLPKMKRGGVIGGDDHHETEHPGVIRACFERFGDDYEVRKDDVYGWPCWRKVVL